jgi:repressor LexA
MAHTTPGRTRERVFRFVRDRLLAGAPPTVREVQQAMGFGAVESARKQLEALVGEGRLVKQPGRSRGYGLPRVDRVKTARVPLLGEIQAGDLRTAIEAPLGWLIVDSRFPVEELFALEVRGDSMIGRGILAGDVVIVRRQPRAETGDVVVALVGDEATVKTLRLQRQRLVLEPANPDFAPLTPPRDEVSILGKVIEVRRKLV